MKKLKTVVCILAAALVVFAAAWFVVIRPVPALRYMQAQNLLSQGGYEKAAELFDGLGSYEESPRLRMYASAILCGEAGDCAAAVSAFETLGDFRDSGLLAMYYQARGLQAGIAQDPANGIAAIEKYEALTLFRDAQERMTQAQAAVYAAAGRLADEKQYADAAALAQKLGQYMDSAQLVEYYSACSDEAAGSDVQAMNGFAALQDFRDAPQRLAAVQKRIYDDASALLDEQDYDGA